MLKKMYMWEHDYSNRDYNQESKDYHSLEVGSLWRDISQEKGLVVKKYITTKEDGTIFFIICVLNGKTRQMHDWPLDLFLNSFERIA